MARRKQEDPKAEMTPMIDVVFQLMIFFIVTIKQEDIFSKLNANRPAPNQNLSDSVENDTQINIQIGPRGFVFNGRGVTINELRRNLAKLAKTSTKATVLVRCELDSPHMYLVQALDACAEQDMHNISIFSM
jgi:biopolymer transport protein ExbD